MVEHNLKPRLLQACRDRTIFRRIISHLSNHDLCTLRKTSCAFSNMVTKILFGKICLTFSPSLLSRHSRVEALRRIGHHIKHFTFRMHHSDATFLPPLLNPRTGQEIDFLYTPHTSLESDKKRPKHQQNLLTAQYPTIFHAATNVRAFIKALACMVQIERISISCPNQEPSERYRRSAVDYALISLRIAIERVELRHLTKLSLGCHPAALLYLHPTLTFGGTPSGRRRWHQIKHLKLSIDSWPFDSAPTDHFKLLANYLRVFAGNVEKLTFHWYGERGPCPLTTPALSPAARPLHFKELRKVQAMNTHSGAEKVFICFRLHADTIKSINFDNVVLTSGTWHNALLPLGRWSVKEALWEARRSGPFTGTDIDFLSCG